MTVSSEISEVSFDTDGVTTAFPVPFYFLANDHLRVWLFYQDTGVETDLVLGSSYLVTGAGNPAGGTVTTSTAYPVGPKLRIERVVPITQETAYQRNDPFPERAHERALDKLTMICQQLSGFFGLLPGSTLRALLLGRNDADGHGAYRARGNRIQDLADPVAEQDAVNRRSMFSFVFEYVDKAIAGVVGGFGSFLQAGIGAVFRTFQDKMRDRYSVKDFNLGVVDGVSSNQAGIEAAVQRCWDEGAALEWPDGTYISTGNIPHFHEVRHIGLGGVLKRGINTWDISGRAGAHVIHASPAGSNDNDGLTPDYPRLPRGAALALYNWLEALMRNGTFAIQCAAGTYTDGIGLISGIPSKNFIEVRGPNVGGGVPTAVFDGTSATTQDCMAFHTRMQVRVRDILILNWNTVAGGSSGVVGYSYTTLWTTNVRVHNCNFTGIAGDTHGHLYVEGGQISQCRYNLRAYGNTQFIIGYNGAPTTLSAATEAAFYVRDSSAGDVLGCVIQNNTAYGINLTNQARARVSGSTFSGNNIAVYATMASTWYDDTSIPNTFTGNTRDSLLYAGSLDSANLGQYQFDRRTKSHLWGEANSSLRYHWKHSTSGAALTSTTQFLLEDIAPVLGLAGNGTGATGLQVCVPGAAQKAYMLYVFSDESWRMQINNADSYRFGTAYFQPMTDNDKTNGSAARRWSTFYAGTGTINTSDAREKTPLRPFTAAEIAAAQDLAGDVGIYQWLQAIAQKGDVEARWHSGLTVQGAIEVLRSHGLDPMRYGFICYDAWEATPEVLGDDGQVLEAAHDAGDRYSLRPDELAFFIVRGLLEAQRDLRASTDELSERVRILEARA